MLWTSFKFTKHLFNFSIYLCCLTNNACIKGHLEPTQLKSSPLFTFSTKSLGQDSPSIHFFSKKGGSRFTSTKIKLGKDSPSWFVFFFLVKIHFQTKKLIKQQNACSFKIHRASNIIRWRFTKSKNKIDIRFTNPEICKPQDSTSRWRRIFDEPWGGWVQDAHWRLNKSAYKLQ